MTTRRPDVYRAAMNVIACRWICCLLFALSPALAAAQDAPRGPIDARVLAARLPAGAAPPPSWLDDGGTRAREAVRLLRDAPAHGLDPARYDADGLAARLDGGMDDVAALTLERDLGTAMLQYLADLHFGRVASGYRLPSDDGFDPVDHLREALRTGRLGETVDAASPPFPMVRRIEATLARYRALAAANLHWPDLPPLPAQRIEPGMRYAGTALVRERLRLFGDLDAEPPAGDVYTPDLAAAVRRFQARHGLAEDGVLGAGTLAALAVPPARRVTQLELTLERLRWLPRPPQGRVVVVDVPAYRLWAFDGRDPSGQLLEMRVIVGAAARTPTPLFIGQMRYLEFNPYWNVPRSIEKAEIIPKLARDPGYLARNDMQAVSTAGQVLPDAGALAALRAGTARVRQRPGPKNALGAVKFAMPNPMNIYLHSTSAQALFARSRRDLSHGCIRVEDPAALARFVLADPVRWDAGAVAAALRPGRTVTVPLREPVPVVLFYATALTDRDGRALFADDVYGLDEQLVQALRAD
jgi:murein L,D-transpeptidase YcbB/YkuD